MIRRFRFILVATLLLSVYSCSNVHVPTSFVETNTAAVIYPDYTDVTVPVNIAPLTFVVDDEEVTAVVAEMKAGNECLVCGGDAVQPDIDDWKSLAGAAAKGDGRIQVDVYAEKGGAWNHYTPFSIYVSKDSIDAYLSYRLIPPSYEIFEHLTINQRCLENYDESEIYNNMLCTTDKGGQCINCHSYQNYNPDRFQFHARQEHGGTVICYDGKIEVVNLKCDSLISSGVYPAWHPTLPLIAYSTNLTSQSFHTADSSKVEVLDTASDLVLYDVELGEVVNIESYDDELEIFPSWTPDGKTLYYCSAYFLYSDSIDRTDELYQRYKEVKYNLYRRHFDAQTRTFSERELVYDAASLGQSATFPRISPDGNYLMFTRADHGCFHIWHHDADIYLMDLRNDSIRVMTECNSSDTESYHSWSSNGKWVVISSRRNDGNYTRPFFAHFNADGYATKPFELPEKNPLAHRLSLLCFNIPEFMHGPVTVAPKRIASELKKDAPKNARFVSKR